MPRQLTCRTGARNPCARAIAHRFCATPRTKKLKTSPQAARRACNDQLLDRLRLVLKSACSGCTRRSRRKRPQRRPGNGAAGLRGAGMGAGIEQFNVVLRTCACVRACWRVFDMIIHRWFEARIAQLDPTQSPSPRLRAHRAHTSHRWDTPLIFEARGADHSGTAANTLKPPKPSTVPALAADLRPADSHSWNPSLGESVA